ncbi:MAG: 16S rRNA (guanine(966)-N(2))-methyltransferase RsmD [Acetobacteraceae bacterium]|nr:16S rRNA (guanine(966)-N(2))-methyltransferase RsmD [Acetobacteraceae bacterium]
MRIIGGAWRGRRLVAPGGEATRPTADRVRQALFDMLTHAAWGGREAIEGARVFDAFAGTGALGLEALSRGAGFATFVENDRAALAALRANIAACKVEGWSKVLAGDVFSIPYGEPCRLVFLDPPYGQGLPVRAVEVIAARGWLEPGTLIVAETGEHEAVEVPPAEKLAERVHGAARITVWRAGR